MSALERQALVDDLFSSRLSPFDDALLWLCVKHPPTTRSCIARYLGVHPSPVSVAMNRLASLGYIEPGRGSCIPLPSALNRVSRMHEPPPRVQERLAERFDPPTHAGCLGGETEHTDPSPTARHSGKLGTVPGLSLAAMEPRGSIDPSLQDLIDQLARAQDPLLAQANAQLRLRVTELEARNVELECRLAKALRRLGFAADALTG